MLPQPSFRIDGEVIHITNGHSRGRSIFLIVVAFFIASLPLLRPYLPADTYVVFDDGQAGWMIGLFAIFACFSAAFWWSTAVIDQKADEVVIRSRWGLFCSQWRRPLSSFDSVAIREDDDRCVHICLEQTASSGWLKNKSIVWGRDGEEAYAIAKSVAQHLQFALNDYRKFALPKLPS